jgi:outer membrane protein
MKISLALIVMLASGMALGAAAQTPAAPPATPAAPAKIGVIAFEVAVAKTNEGARIFADLQKKYEPKTEELKAQNTEIETLSKQLETQEATLSAADRASRTKTIEEKKKKLQREAEELDSDGKQDMQQRLGELGPKVYEVMVDYAKQHGFTVVFDASQQDRTILYAVDTANITKEVIDAYNTKSGVSAPPAPAQPAIPKPQAPPTK